MTTPSTTTTTSTTSTSTQPLRQASSINGSDVVGNYVTSTTVKPYMAPQVISFFATDMRPFTRVHVFYDGVNVDQYCAPGQELQAGWSGGSKYMTVRTGNWGDPITVTDSGLVMGQFNVPEGVFKVGVGVLEIADIDDLNNPDKINSATTVCAAKFVSGNLTKYKQLQTPTTREPGSSYLPFTKSVIDPTTSNDLTFFGKVSDYAFEWVAQSFKIPDGLGTPGVFLHSIDLWFRNAPPSSIYYDPVTNYGATEQVHIYICELKNGYPDESAILPYSQSYMPAYANRQSKDVNADRTPIYMPINISSNGNDGAFTRFNFEGGVYCVAGKEYAVVVRPYANDPAWQLWISNLGAKDIVTGRSSQSTPAWVGSSYYGYNGKQWGGAPDKANTQKWTKWENTYFKFRIQVAKFTGRRFGHAYFQEKARDYLTLYNVTYPNSDPKYQKILPGDFVYLANDSFCNTTVANVVGHDGSQPLQWGIVDHYDEHRQILYVDTSEMWNSNFWFTTDKLWPTPTINTRFRTSGTFPSNSFVQIHRSPTNYNYESLATYNYQTGESLASPPYPAYIYVQNGYIGNSNYVAYANTGENYNPKINTLVPQFNTFTPPGTNIFWDYVGISNNFVVDSANTTLSTINEEITLHDYERIVASRSTANIGFQDKKTMTIHAYLTSDNDYLTPFIDCSKTEVLAVRNLIDPISSTYQEFYNTGSARSKYISQVVTLAEGQDAEDLQVILSAYRPPTSDIQVWVKFLSADDSESISLKTWTPMRNNNISLFCDPANEDDMKDFIFSVPYSYPLVPTSGSITCNSSCTAIVGSGTLFDTEVGVGWYINMPANSTVNETSRKIVSVTDNTHLVIDTPFNSDYTGNAYFIVPPPTTAWLSQNTSIQVDGLVSTSTTNNAVIGYSVTFTANTSKINNTTEAITIPNANTYFNPDDRIYYRVPTGNTAIGGLTGNTWYYVKYSNTTTLSLTDTLGGSLINLTGVTTNPGETHEFVSTNFTYWYQPGSIIDVNGDKQTVVSVANDTYLTVGAPWTLTNTNQPAYLVSSAGLTYENSAGAIYSKYKKFQIKIVLQSNDTSKVPVLDNLRALSLQL